MRKRILQHVFVPCLLTALAVVDVQAEKLVILSTNDTHSQIDPDDRDNLGGVLRRKAIIDSVRSAEKNVLLVDAGDAVQGTLFFNLYGGEVEQMVMNELGYDIRILGNHEFDNGADSLASVLKGSRATLVSTNYDLSGSPLAGMVSRYAIREFGDKRVGVIAINLNPDGIISDGNYDGVVYQDGIKAANAYAWWLRNVEKADAVIALSHIGYNDTSTPVDPQLAAMTENIDVIIGGHSHELIDPRNPVDSLKSTVVNLAGKNVLITQLGKAGKNVGKIVIDFDSLDAQPDYSLIAVDSRLDNHVDMALKAKIDRYRAGVDSLMRVPVGRSAVELPRESQALLNFVSDFVYDRGSRLSNDVDFAIVNKGGIRRGLPKGTLTEGVLISMLPFNNYVNVIDIKGCDLIPAFRQMAAVGGNGVSRQVKVEYEKEDEGKPEVDVTVNGEPLDPDRTYRVATIDYLANGGDYMPTLRKHTLVAKSDGKLYDDLLEFFRTGAGKGKRIKPSGAPRMIADNN